MNIGGGCYLCGHNEETVDHLFLDCPYTKNALPLDISAKILSISEAQTRLDKVNQFWSGLSKLEREQIALVWHGIWSERNLVWKGKTARPSSLISQQATLNANQSRPSMPQLRWTKPRAGVMKTNVDFAVSTLDQACGIGTIIRDEDGAFIAGKTIFSPSITDPSRDEILATKEGLIFAWKLGCLKVHLEGDAKEVYRRLEEQVDDFFYNGSLYQDLFMFAS